PGRSPQQREQVRRAEPLLAGSPRLSLDFPNAAALVLGTERHENRAGDGKRDAEQKPGVVEQADELVGRCLRDPEGGVKPAHDVERSGTFSERASADRLAWRYGYSPDSH